MCIFHEISTIDSFLCISQDILLSLAFEELSWDYTPAPAHEPGCLDTFWLEFDAPDRSSDPEAVQRLQIFSKQVLMDSIFNWTENMKLFTFRTVIFLVKGWLRCTGRSTSSWGRLRKKFYFWRGKCAGRKWVLHWNMACKTDQFVSIVLLTVV